MAQRLMRQIMEKTDLSLVWFWLQHRPGAAGCALVQPETAGQGEAMGLAVGRQWNVTSRKGSSSVEAVLVLFLWPDHNDPFTSFCLPVFEQHWHFKQGKNIVSPYHCGGFTLCTPYVLVSFQGDLLKQKYCVPLCCSLLSVSYFLTGMEIRSQRLKG